MKLISFSILIEGEDSNIIAISIFFNIILYIKFISSKIKFELFVSFISLYKFTIFSKLFSLNKG